MDTDIALSTTVIVLMGCIGIGCVYYIFCRKVGGIKQSDSMENLTSITTEDPRE